VPEKKLLIFLGIVAAVLISLLPAVIKHFREYIKSQKNK
jgi:hypothetical protein